MVGGLEYLIHPTAVTRDMSTGFSSVTVSSKPDPGRPPLERQGKCSLKFNHQAVLEQFQIENFLLKTLQSLCVPLAQARCQRHQSQTQFTKCWERNSHQNHFLKLNANCLGQIHMTWFILLENKDYSEKSVPKRTTGSLQGDENQYRKQKQKQKQRTQYSS